MHTAWCNRATKINNKCYLNLYYEKPVAQGTIRGVCRWRNATQDVTQSTSEVQTVYSWWYTGMEIRPNRDFNG